MNYNKKDNLDNLITQVSQTYEVNDQPGAELNNLLKAKVREKESILLAKKNKKQISLWYLPMMLNCLVCIAVALISQILIQSNNILHIINGACIYLAIAGVILSIAGIKLSTLKTAFTVEWNKGGSLA